MAPIPVEDFLGADVFLVTPTGLAALPVAGAAGGAVAPGADAVVGVAVGDEDEEVLAAAVAGFALFGLAVRLMAGSVSTF